MPTEYIEMRDPGDEQPENPFLVGLKVECGIPISTREFEALQRSDESAEQYRERINVQ